MNHPSANLRPALWCSIVGGVAAIALSIFLRSLLGTRLLAEVVLDATTDGSSPENFSFLLKTLEELARPLLFTGVIAGQLVAYLAVWQRVAGLRSYVFGLAARELTAVVASAGLFIAPAIALGVAFDAPLGSSTSWPEYAVVTLLSAVTFVLVTRALESWDASISGAPADRSRRLPR